MTPFLGVNRAAPMTVLLGRDDAKSLGFATAPWKHLNRYVGAVEALPPGLEGGTAASSGALTTLRSLAEGFGSPKQLRQLILDQPDALTEDQFPSTLYAGLAWLIQHLHQSASSVVAILRNLSSARSAGDLRADLQRLGRDADTARRAIGPLLAGLKSFQTEIIEANDALSSAYRADADTLRQMQEQLGSLQVRIASLQKQIEQLGILSARKKHELERQLDALKQQQQETSTRSENLRVVLAAIEPIQGEGFWLEPGLNDLISFLDQLRLVLTTFGSGMTQLAADASDAQLKDTTRMQTLLGMEASIQQWEAIAGAALQYLTQSTIDFPTVGTKDQ